MPEDINLTNHCLEGLTNGIVSYHGNPTKDLSPDHLYQIRGFQNDAENFPSGFVCVEDCHTRKILVLPFSYTLYFRKPVPDTTDEQSSSKCTEKIRCNGFGAQISGPKVRKNPHLRDSGRGFLRS